MSFPFDSDSSRNEQGVQLSESDLVDLLANFVDGQPSSTTTPTHDEDSDVQQLLKVMQQAREAHSEPVHSANNSLYDEAKQTTEDDEDDEIRKEARESYPDSLIDFSDSPSSYDDYPEDPFEKFHSSITQFYTIAQTMDLRAEQTYMRSVANTNGSWLAIAWITIKDQALYPAVQGCGMRLFRLLLGPWLARVGKSGNRAGGEF